MLGFISLLMVIVFSIYFYLNYVKMEMRHPDTAKCIPMLLGMTGGLAVGLVFGIWFPEMLAVSTILSILASAGTTWLIGTKFGVNCQIEAQASSLMGAVMGAMLGVMLGADEVTLMLIAFDIIYLLSFFSITKILEKDAQAANQPSLKNGLLSFFYIAFLLSICLIGTIDIVQTNSFIHMEKQETIHHHGH
ncbi:hypothetical protein P4U23_16305 [Aeribacillus composti]|uniref:hypothetical protein n=1 Tax=Aeribacillus composti TaxID=1868734 RepID=UPI002E20FC07|nr:hypothetical protein [Aeribacillus composti]